MIQEAQSEIRDGAAAEVLVDVVIPVRNGRAYIAEAIESVVRQSMVKFRLVVVDNNSTDGTTDLLRNFADPRLEIVNHTATRALFENFNFCLSVVHAPFFCLLHADDRMRPNYLECMVHAMQAEAKADLAVCQVMTINGAGQKAFNFKYSLKNKLFLGFHRIIRTGDISSSLLRVFNFLPAPSLFYRSEVLTKIGGFREDMLFFSDLEYLDRGLRRGGHYLIVPKILFEYRLHGDQETSNLTKNLLKYKETLEYFSEMVPRDTNTLPSYRRLGGTAAEARVVLVVLWDFMNSTGPASSEFRTSLIGYLLGTPIMKKCAWLWRMLGRATVWPQGVRKVLCATIIICVPLPVICFRILRRQNIG